MRLLQLPSSVYRALVRREITTTLHNRYVQIFAAVLLVGSLATVLLSGRPSAVPFGLLLLFLYVVPLFGLLIGVSAAHEEHDERPFLWAQPVPRSAYVLSKAVTLAAALSLVLLGALLPAVAMNVSVGALAFLWGLGGALAVVSVSGGVTVGQYTSRRAHGLMVTLVVWFGAFALYDALALALSGVNTVQGWPGLWVSLLLLNPLDAVRLAGLFGLENVPFTVPGEAAWIADLVGWLPAWAGVVAGAWAALLLVLACRRLRRLEL